jgi:hypothetical protein
VTPIANVASSGITPSLYQKSSLLEFTANFWFQSHSISINLSIEPQPLLSIWRIFVWF